MTEGQKIVAVSGGFDPLHRGHVRLFKDARALGDTLVVILNNDNWLSDKKGKPFMSQEERKEIIEAIQWVDRVVLTDHAPGEYFTDRSVCRTLREIKPDIFANGGDRHPEGDPIPEVELCKELGIEAVYNVGVEGKVQSSSWLTSRIPKFEKRPWGEMETFKTTPRWWLKSLTLRPGERISLQKHMRRGEVYVCVEGEVTVEMGDRVFVMRPFDNHPAATLFDPNVVHRLSSATGGTVIEIAIGDCDVKDIVRYEDDYGRN